MCKRILILSIISIISVHTAMTQTADEVTLKSGSVIRGSVIEINTDGKVTIDDAAGNTWVFKMSEIEHIHQIETDNNPSLSPYSAGWANMTSVGILAGSTNSNQIAPFSLISSFGYKNSKGIYTGIAAGMEFLNINHIPILLDLQYFTGNKEVTRVFIFRGGYALPSKSETNNYGNTISYKGGITASLGVGLKIRTIENFAWDISVLYRYMEIEYSEFNEWSQQDYLYTDIYNRLELRVGFYLN